MKRDLLIIPFLISSISIFGLPSLSAETRYGWLHNPTPANYSRQNVIVPATPRPTPVLSVSPPEESRQTGVRSVGVELAPKEGEGVAGGSLQLLIDGVDVTSLAEIANTRDGCLVSPDCSPPSGGGIYYTPNGLEPGLHHALIRFQTKEGKTKSYTWSFSIESP